MAHAEGGARVKVSALRCWLFRSLPPLGPQILSGFCLGGFQALLKWPKKSQALQALRGTPSLSHLLYWTESLASQPGGTSWKPLGSKQQQNSVPASPHPSPANYDYPPDVETALAATKMGLCLFIESWSRKYLLRHPRRFSSSFSSLTWLQFQPLISGIWPSLTLRILLGGPRQRTVRSSVLKMLRVGRQTTMYLGNILSLTTQALT